MYITLCCQTDHTGMTGSPDAYANLPKLSRVLQLSLNGTGDTQERGHVPSSCFSSSVQRRLQLLALLQPHSCTFISFSTFIYLFSNSRIDEKQGCAFTEREGRSASERCVWTAAPDWRSPCGWLDIVRWALFHLRCSSRINQFILI